MLECSLTVVLFAFALYLVALLTALLQAGFFFMRVVGSLLVAAVS